MKEFYEKDWLKKSDVNLQTFKKISKRFKDNRPKTMGGNIPFKIETTSYTDSLGQLSHPKKSSQ